MTNRPLLENEKLIGVNAAGIYSLWISAGGTQFGHAAIVLEDGEWLTIEHFKKVAPHPNHPESKEPAEMDAIELLAALNDAIRFDDYAYNVRERAIENDPDYKGESWDHPDVERYGELCTRARKLINGQT